MTAFFSCATLGEPLQTLADIYATLQSHSFLNNNYQALAGLSDSQLASLYKFENPVLIDVGPGNIRIFTAIDLISNYLEANPSDPLQLSAYQNSYSRLARELAAGWGPSSEVSVKIAGLMVKEATTFFSQNAAT